MKIKCFLFGHQGEVVDGQFYACTKCNSHEYHDDRYCDTLPNRWYTFKNRLSYWWYSKFHRCSDCCKAKKRFGRFVGNHDNCLPF